MSVQPHAEITAEFPEKLTPLMESENRRRYYIAYGGRGSGKSWSFARALVLQSIKEPLRVLCAREVMRTIEDSVHRLLCDQVAALNAGWYFDCKDSYIAGTNGAEFSYAGLRQQDATKIKSFEGADICWVEEGQSVVKKSWDILIPTIRAESSEIWVTMNPELDTDDSYQRFIAKPPDNSWVQKVNYNDNPWFPDVLEQERLRCERGDPEGYRNIWLGEPRTVVEGAIYAREVVQMIEERRLRPAPYDPRLKVHTIWDLGWNDQTSIIFAQRLLSEVRIIDYEEESFLRFDEWAGRILKKPYLYGSHWLPHDGGNKLQAANGNSAQEILRPMLGMRPRLIPRPETKEVPIHAARMMFPRVYVNETKCARLVECLKRYKRAVPESTGEPGKPVHDANSHGADAFGGLAMIVNKLENEAPPQPKVEPFRALDPISGY